MLKFWCMKVDCPNLLFNVGKISWPGHQSQHRWLTSRKNLGTGQGSRQQLQKNCLSHRPGSPLVSQNPLLSRTQKCGNNYQRVLEYWYFLCPTRCVYESLTLCSCAWSVGMAWDNPGARFCHYIWWNGCNRLGKCLTHPHEFCTLVASFCVT